MKRTRLVPLALVLAVALFASAGAEEIRREFDESFDVAEGASLHLRHGDGDAIIIPWEQDVIRVEVVYHAEVKGFGFHDDLDFDVEFRQSDDVVEVIGKEPSLTIVGFFYSRYHEYTYTVHAPPYVVLRLEGDDGDVTIEGWSAAIECRLDDGDLLLREVRCPRVEVMIEDGATRGEELECELSLDGDDGDVTLKRCNVDPCLISVDDGDVDLMECSGEIRVSADDGDISLSSVRSVIMDIEADDGDVDVAVVGETVFDLDVSTDDGDVRIETPPGLSADFRIDVDDGVIEVELPEIREFVNDEGRASGVIGAGEGRIRINTDDGDVSLKES